MNAVRWWQRAAGLLMVLFLLTIGWKMRAFIWTAVQNAVVRSWYPVWGTNLRDIPDSEEGKRHRLAGWKKQTQIRPIINIWKNRKSGRSIRISWHSFPGVGWWMELYLENGTGLFMEVGDRAAERQTKRGCIVLERMEKRQRGQILPHWWTARVCGKSWKIMII